jgi:hypothetical protein
VIFIILVIGNLISNANFTKLVSNDEILGLLIVLKRKYALFRSVLDLSANALLIFVKSTIYIMSIL